MHHNLHEYYTTTLESTHPHQHGYRRENAYEVFDFKNLLQTQESFPRDDLPIYREYNLHGGYERVDGDDSDNDDEDIRDEDERDGSNGRYV